MHIEHLNEFLLLVDAGSFRQAARKAFVSQSALSKHIANLENHFGVELLDKSQQGVHLTECGTRAYEGAKRVMEAYNRMANSIDEARQMLDRRITVGYLKDAAQPFLLNLVVWFERKRPDFELRLVSLRYESIATALREGAVDAVIVMADSEDLTQGCTVLPIYNDRLALAVAPSHPLAKKESATRDMIRGEHLIVPSESVWPYMNSRIRQFAALTEDSDCEYVGDVDTLFLLLESGRGIAVVSSHNKYAYGDRVTFIDFDEEDNPSFPVSLIWTNDLEENPGKEAKLACLKEGLRHVRKGLDPQDLKGIRFE